MSGAINKANSRQGRTHKPQYDRYKNRGSRDVNKVIKMARDEKRKEVAKEKLFARHQAGKPVPARFLKRHGLV